MPKPKAKAEPESIPAISPDDARRLEFSGAAKQAASPSIAAAARISTISLEHAREVVVESQAEFALVVEETRHIERRIAELNDRRLAITRPMDAAKKEVMELFAEPIDRLTEAAQLNRAALAKFTAAERKKADDARAEAERKEREERDRLAAEQARLQEAARKAAKKGDDKKAAALLAQADDVGDRMDTAAAAPLPAFRRPTAPGSHEVERWIIDRVTIAELVCACADELRAEKPDDRLLQFIAANEVEIGKVVRSLRNNHRIPGVIAKRVDTLAIRK